MAAQPVRRRVGQRAATCYTYGHRNVQGLAQRADGTLWSVEHGTYRDDEVNLLVNGGDYGWNPVPGYNESVPMTDQSLPGTQIARTVALRRPTLATSGGSFVNGAKWGGSTARSRSPASRPAAGLPDLRRQRQAAAGPAAASAAQFGRIRAVVQAANGDLLVTTDNGGGNDVILRVRPRSRR